MLIYVIEDDLQHRDFFTKVLQADQHEVIAFQDTLTAHNYFMSHTAPDAVLIDFRFDRGPNGLSLARQIHAVYPTSAVVMTSCYADKKDIIEAFRNGIDDFLIKPVDPKDLVKCLGDTVIMRRTRFPIDTAERQIGSLKLNPQSRQAWWYGRLLELTKTEYTILLKLTANPGHIFNYADLYANCTGDHIDPSEAAKKLKTHIHNLKTRFKRISTTPCPILARRGEGVLWQIDTNRSK